MTWPEPKRMQVHEMRVFLAMKSELALVQSASGESSSSLHISADLCSTRRLSPLQDRIQDSLEDKLAPQLHETSTRVLTSQLSELERYVPVCPS